MPLVNPCAHSLAFCCPCLPSPAPACLQPKQLFYLCAGETPDSLRPGRRVEARVRFVGEMEARCVLPDLNNLEGVVMAGEVSRKAALEAQQLAGGMAGMGGMGINVREYLKSNETYPARWAR